MAINARCLPVRDTRPPARRLLEPVEAPAAQPMLPWPVPDITPAPQELDPELRQVAAAVTTAVVEVLAGRRPAYHLERWLDPDVLDLVSRLGGDSSLTRLRVRSVRVQSPADGVLEVAAQLRSGQIARAAALRVERDGDDWTVTALEIALRPRRIRRAGPQIAAPTW